MSAFQDELKALLPDIMSGPELYLHALDMEKGQGLLIRAGRDFYKQAVFLDQRVLTDKTEGAWVPLTLLFKEVVAAGGRQAPANFIFHTGHSGSTLISRLLDEIPQVLGLREPLALRTLAEGQLARDQMPAGAYEGVLGPVYKLLVRRFSPEQQVVIKATSMCNNLAPDLLVQNPANKGLLLYVPLETYLANMLDKADTPDIGGHFAHRVGAFRQLFPEADCPLSNLSKPEMIAFSWLAEAAHFLKLSEGAFAPRLLAVDFDQFLNQRDVFLGLILNHFGLSGGDETLGRLLASPVFRGYAKKPDFSYTPENRAAILRDSRSTNKNGIFAGIRYAEDLIENVEGLSALPGKFPLSR